MTLTDLLLRDPEHPEIRALLELRYRQVCMERKLLIKLLGVVPEEEKARGMPGPYVGGAMRVVLKDDER